VSAPEKGDAVRKLAIAVSSTLLLVGLLVGVTFASAAIAGSIWGATASIYGAYVGAFVALSASSILAMWLDEDIALFAILGVILTDLGGLWSLIGFDVIHGSEAGGHTLYGVVGLIVAGVGLPLLTLWAYWFFNSFAR
jgi:hypothetical protein